MRLDPKQLDHFRTQGDAAADQLVIDLLAAHGTGLLKSIFPRLSDFTTHDFADIHPLFAEFYAKQAQYPAGYNRKEVVRATNIYKKHQQNIGLQLACYALPYCYLAEDGARVLTLTERIGKDTYTRLKETGNFLRAAMQYQHWEQGSIFSVLFKVRLLHALVRYFTAHAPTWQMEWGVPINQEDMAGTNLAFSYIVLRGLRKINISLDQQAERAYLTLWRYIGQLLGIVPELLVSDLPDAVRLDQQIAMRHFRASASGQTLAASLMQCYTDQAGGQLAGQYLVAQTRFLLGNGYADMLAIPPAPLPTPVLKIYNQTTALVANIFT